MDQIKRKEQKSTSCRMSKVTRVQTPSKQLADEALSQRNHSFPVSGWNRGKWESSARR